MGEKSFVLMFFECQSLVMTALPVQTDVQVFFFLYRVLVLFVCGVFGLHTIANIEYFWLGITLKPVKYQA